MFLRRILDNIRRKDIAERKFWMWTFVFLSMTVFIVLWIFSLKVEFNKLRIKEGSTPLSAEVKKPFLSSPNEEVENKELGKNTEEEICFDCIQEEQIEKKEGKTGPLLPLSE